MSAGAVASRWIQLVTADVGLVQRAGRLLSRGGRCRHAEVADAAPAHGSTTGAHPCARRPQTRRRHHRPGGWRAVVAVGAVVHSSRSRHAVGGGTHSRRNGEATWRAGLCPVSRHGRAGGQPPCPTHAARTRHTVDQGLSLSVRDSCGARQHGKRLRHARGYIVFHTALLEKAERAEEVAGVLAHEIQHVELR
ncbi:MAG: hypothetical protein FJY37_19520, partial [Betaproteobacteria bacterium]|nr:hypothetical protein [Betaproteobacteria bacterium]